MASNAIIAKVRVEFQIRYYRFGGEFENLVRHKPALAQNYKYKGRKRSETTEMKLCCAA